MMKKNKIKTLINEEHDILESCEVVKPLEKEKEIEHLKVDENVRKEIRKKNAKITRSVYNWIAAICFILFASILLLAVSYLPAFGTEGRPTLNEIYDHYIEAGIPETGAINFVSGMILDYRAFDTLGESFVLFTAVTCVFILLKNTKNTKKSRDDLYTLKQDPILKACASIIVPIILMYGMYVILNGSISPGGGFSGGAIIGAGLIFYSLVFGHHKMHRFFNMKTFKIITSASLLTYASTKAYAFFTGANHLPSIFEELVHVQTPGAIFSGGLIFILNVCVGLVVSCTMYGFYALFRRGEI